MLNDMVGVEENIEVDVAGAFVNDLLAAKAVFYILQLIEEG